MELAAGDQAAVDEELSERNVGGRVLLRLERLLQIGRADETSLDQQFAEPGLGLAHRGRSTTVRRRSDSDSLRQQSTTRLLRSEARRTRTCSVSARPAGISTPRTRLRSARSRRVTCSRVQLRPAGTTGHAWCAPRRLGSSSLSARRFDYDRGMGAPTRMPVVFIPHGGGPWPFVEMGFPPEDVARLADYLRSVRDVPPVPPRALLVVSAHWEAPVPTVMTAEHPPMLYDYYGFPPESYTITWPAPGSPALAARVRALLGAAGIRRRRRPGAGLRPRHVRAAQARPTRRPTCRPCSCRSRKGSTRPSTSRSGARSQPLRDEGVFIVASGMTFHNLRAFRDPRAAPVSEAFDAWLRESAGARGRRTQRAPRRAGRRHPPRAPRTRARST